MNTINKLAFTLAGLLLAGTSYGQTTAGSPATSSSPSTSIRDNPGVLGHTFGEVNYSWMDFNKDNNVDPEGFIVGLRGNAPVSRGLDVGLGYNYFRENNHRNPFDNSPYDLRYHQLNAGATLFAPVTGPKPFLSGGVGYQWSRGDIQRLRTYDSQWIWNAGAGVELPMGTFSLTPRVTFSDSFDSNGIGVWHYGGELHHWFNEKMGGYVDVTFHDPKGRVRPEVWTYTAGLRMRF